MSMQCPRCGNEMNHIKREKLQFGQTGWILGDLPNLIAGALEVDIYCCTGCGKLEFYRADMYTERTFASNQHEPSDLPQRTCPNCGILHDFDYPMCPVCGHDYEEE